MAESWLDTGEMDHGQEKTVCEQSGVSNIPPLLEPL